MTNFLISLHFTLKNPKNEQLVAILIDAVKVKVIKNQRLACASKKTASTLPSSGYLTWCWL